MKYRVTVVLVMLAAAVGATAWNGRRAADEVEAHAPVLPTRTSAPTPAPIAPPSLSAIADRLPALAFTVATHVQPRGTPGQRTTQQVVRTSDRLHLTLGGTKKEWLFERNPLDGRRVSGYLIDHDAKRIIAYQESDLRNEQHLRGWADVLMMRFDSKVLSSLRATGEEEIVGGSTFAHFVAVGSPEDGVLDVWWSESLLLPLRLTVRRGGTTTTATVSHLVAATDLSVIADPRQRLPTYHAIDEVDARERQ